MPDNDKYFTSEVIVASPFACELVQLVIHIPIAI